MFRTKKRIVYVMLGLILLISTNFTLNYFNESVEKQFQSKDNALSDDPSFLKTSQDSTFIVGVASSPVDLDPVNSWDSASNNLIEQVSEGLFRYNLSDHNLPRINWLAEEFWYEDKATLHLKLREGVLFHDGTPFNATAAKWNLDRLLYLTNCTGTLPPTTPVAQPSSLWKFPNGTAIINQVDVVNEYNITIHLNGAFAPLLDLLSYTNAYMLSPKSTPALDYIDLATGDLVGTGPFIYDGYIPDTEVSFSAFDFYWQGKANITDMTFSIIFDSVTRNDAMLAHTIDFLDNHLNTYIPSFEVDPSITVTHFTDTFGISSLIYYYLGFNNEEINKTMRKAVSYAINYTYIIEELQSGEVIRANSPISPGFGDSYNSSTKAATLNLAKARQILIDAGIANPAWDADNDTNDPNWLNAEFAIYNYTFNWGNTFREDLFILLQDNLDQIGITLEDEGMTFPDFIQRLYFENHKLELFWIGWGPDYLDPFNMLDPLFNPISIDNSAQVNDPQLNTMLENALKETSDAIRDNIYKDIQGYLAEQLYPHAFGYHPKITYVYSANLTNYPHNALDRLYFYPCKWDRGEIKPSNAKIFIDDSDPNYNWSKTALENEWCSGSGTWSDPYVIKDIEVDGEFTYNGIEIYNSSVYFKIKNCTIHKSYEYGIKLVNTNNSIIHNNSVCDTPGVAMYLEYSNNHTISYNEIWNITSLFGGFSLMLLHSNHCEVKNNTITSSVGGIASGYNFDVMISDNEIFDNSYMGIATGLSTNTTIKQNDIINNTVYGIAIQESNKTIVKNNLVTDSLYMGIVVMGMWNGCHDNEITENQIFDNLKIGLALDNYSASNIIFQNTFVGNGINAQDNGTSNAWDNGIIGNSWDDYIGVDADDDGIGDTPYLIDGEAGSVDNYPIFDDGPDGDITPPIITINEPDSGDEFTTTPPIYDIDVTEANLDSMWYTMNNGVNNITITSLTGTLDGTIWNALPYGVVTITFYANDTYGNIGYDTVLVYKNEPTTEGPEIPGIHPIFLILIVSLGVLGLSWRNKQKLN